MLCLNSVPRAMCPVFLWRVATNRAIRCLRRRSSQALKVSQSAHGEHSVEVADVLSELAYVLALQGRYALHVVSTTCLAVPSCSTSDRSLL